MSDPAQLLALIDQGRSDTAIQYALDHHLQSGSVTRTVETLLAPAQVEAGERWQYGAWTVAQEHATTVVVDDILGMLNVRITPQRSQKTVLVVCAEAEWHLTPARMAATILRENGWRTKFLGGSVPAEHLRRTLEAAHVEALAVSCTLPLALPGAVATIEAAHDVGVPVLVGGRAFGQDDRRAVAVGADAWAASPTQGAAVLDHWLDHPPHFTTAPTPSTTSIAMENQRTMLVESALESLLARHPAFSRYNATQLDTIREDLDDLLQFFAVAQVVADPSVFTDFVRWRDQLLTKRGVPRAALDAGAAALADHLPRDLAEDFTSAASRESWSETSGPAAPRTASHQGGKAVAGVAARSAEAPTGRLRVLLVEDDPVVVRLLEASMHDRGMVDLHGEVATSLAEAITLLATESFDVVLLDLSLPDSQGLTTVTTLLEAHPTVPVVVLTGTDDDLLAAAAIEAGAQDYLAKGSVTPEMLARVVCNARDRRGLLMALELREHMFRAMAESAQDAIYRFRIRPTFEFEYLNPAVADLSGFPLQQFRDDPNLYVQRVHRRDRWQLDVDQLDPAGVNQSITVRFQRANGEWIVLEDHRTPIVEGGVVVGVQGVVRDVTAGQRTTQALHDALKAEQRTAEELRAANDLKGQFLQAVSRDELQVDRVQTDVTAIAEEVAQGLSMGGRHLVVEDAACVASLDAGMVEGILRNLLANTIKHTPPDTSVTVRCTRDDDVARISVIDDGPGIPEHLRQDAFESFWTGTGLLDAPSGTGVGLAVVRHFAALHGGHAWLEATPSGGTTVHVELAVRAAAEDADRDPVGGPTAPGQARAPADDMWRYLPLAHRRSLQQAMAELLQSTNAVDATDIIVEHLLRAGASQVDDDGTADATVALDPVVGAVRVAHPDETVRPTLAGQVEILTAYAQHALATSRLRPSPDPVDGAAVVLWATRELLSAGTAEELVGIVLRAVHALGGGVLPARLEDEESLPLDLTLSRGEPLLPTAEAGSPARGLLQRHLPGLVADARGAVDRLRDQGPPGGDADTGLATRQELQRLLAHLDDDDVIVVVDLHGLPELALDRVDSQEVVRDFANCLREQLGASDHAARVGDDEFALLLRGAGRAGTVEALERLYARWEQLRTHPVGFSAGIAVGAEHDSQSLRTIEQALSVARSTGPAVHLQHDAEGAS